MRGRRPRTFLHNHLFLLGGADRLIEDLGHDRGRDFFGVVWDRSVDRDIGIVGNYRLPEPTLHGFTFPDPLDPRIYAKIPGKIASHGDRWRVFEIGFSLYERAWTLRGTEELMADFYENPAFVHELMRAIAAHKLAQITEALKSDIDAGYFGDGWGQQRGLQMSPGHGREYIYPKLPRR